MKNEIRIRDQVVFLKKRFESSGFHEPTTGKIWTFCYCGMGLVDVGDCRFCFSSTPSGFFAELPRTRTGREKVAAVVKSLNDLFTQPSLEEEFLERSLT